MSPLEIHCLLEYYTMPEGSPDIHHRHPMAIESLLRMGLIEEDPEGNTSKPYYAITRKGQNHVYNICHLDLPVNIWVLPSAVETLGACRHGVETSRTRCPKCDPLGGMGGWQ